MRYYTAITILTWAALIVLTILVHENNRMRRKEKNLFYLTYALVAVAALAECMGVQLSGNPAVPNWLFRLIKTMDYILTPAVGVVLVGQLRSRSIWQVLAFIVLLVNTLLQIISMFFDWMVVVDAQNYYIHGPLYWLYVLMYMFVIAFIGMEFIEYGRSFRRRNALSTYAIVCFVTLAIALQEFSDGDLRTAYLGMTMAASMFLIHVVEYSQLKTDDEMQEQRIQIMLSQIQPHFLFNSLSVIQAAYRIDVEKGDEAITQFAQYLRHNMDSLTQEEPILFAQELEHVQRYLALQKLRFGDELTVRYDLQTENFRLPTLTLQPLVENAVTYGARRHPERRGVVTIGTRELPDRVEVSVQDNGPGFAPEGEGDDTRSHVGLTNVRARLQQICGGDLTITSVPGEGTRAVMTLPREMER